MALLLSVAYPKRALLKKPYCALGSAVGIIIVSRNDRDGAADHLRVRPA
jgi:hypothetical protein